MHPAVGPPVNMPAVILGATTVAHDGTKCHFPLPGAGVFDDSMKETLISVVQLLEANFDIFFRLPHHCLTDGFDPTKYPFYGGFLLLPALLIFLFVLLLRYPTLLYRTRTCLIIGIKKTFHFFRKKNSNL